MSLMTWSAPRKTITLPGGDNFSVRAISLEDITTLWSIYGEELFDIFSSMDLGDNADEKNMMLQAGLAAWISRLTAEFPDIISTVIAITADIDEEIEAVVAQVKLLPLQVQIEALDAIYALSVTEVGGSKKFVDHLSNLLTAVGLGPANTGTGDYASQLAS